MLDEGQITSSSGKTVICKNTIIIMTSNLGASDSERSNIGFGDQQRTGEDDRAMREFFKPEFRNRIDAICKFDKLDMMSIKKIVAKFLDQLKTAMNEKHNIILNFSEDVIEKLASEGYDSKMGARPISRKIDELIRVPLSKKILFERLKNTTINVEVNGSEIIYTTPTLSLPSDVGFGHGFY
jgi:ATP-dependent Clp protease ATP-binding subunit ClpA